MNASSRPGASPGWCLRFLSGAVRGRTIALNPGTSVAGSAADCQILLPSSDVQPRHLIFNAGAVALSVQKVESAAARINGEELPATRRSVVVGDVISVGKIDFQIERSYPAREHADSMFLDADTALAAPATPAAQPRSRARMWTLVAGVWLLAMGGVWWALAGDTSQVRPDGEQINLAALEAVLKDFPEVEVLAGLSGRMSLKGFVESQPRRQALQKAVLPLGPRLSVNVHSVDQLIEQARRFVSDPGVAITYNGKGRLVVSGKSENPDVQEQIRRLGEDLHPAVMVSDKVQYRPKAQAAAETSDQWAEWQRTLPSRMVSITQDAAGMRYIQLANGSLYFEGSVLKSGLELKSLWPDGPITLAQPPNAQSD